MKKIYLLMFVINAIEASPVSVPDGGTGVSSLSAYAVLCGGTTTVGSLQQVSGLGSSGQILTSNGAGALPTWQNKSTIVTTYTAGSGTHTLNANTKVVELIMWGGGAGGGSGRRGSSTAAGGGAGGGTGGFTWYLCPVAFFGGAGAGVSYVVGTGGAGGAAQTVNNTNGNPGSIGTASKFGNIQTYVNANGFGLGGTIGSVAGGSNSNLLGLMAITTPVSTGGTGAVSAPTAGTSASDGLLSATAGGGGGGNNSGATVAGAAGGSINTLEGTLILGGGTAGADGGGTGGDGTSAAAVNSFFCGGTGGGGGGGANNVGTGGNGGAGGVPGGGGGGGAGARNVDSGAGGRGGDGIIYIIEYL